MFDLIPEFTIDYEMFVNHTASINKIGFCLLVPKLKSQLLWTITSSILRRCQASSLYFIKEAMTHNKLKYNSQADDFEIASHTLKHYLNVSF